jgi:hypothetical protein
MTNAYLLPDFEDDEEQARYIRFRARKLFEHELGFRKLVGWSNEGPQITYCYWFN